MGGRPEEALCTIDSALRIRSGWNAAFGRIFGSGRNFDGLPVLDVSFASLSERKRKELREALEVAFLSEKCAEELVSALMPIDEYTHFRLGDAGVEEQRLDFSVDRLVSADRVDALLLRFSAKKAPEAAPAAADARELMLRIARNDRTSVARFFGDLNSGVDSIGDRLRAFVPYAANTRLADEAVVIVHSLRAEAQALGLASAVAAARGLETALAERRMAPLCEDELADLRAAFDRLDAERRSLSALLEEVRSFLHAGPDAALEALAVRLRGLVDDFGAAGYYAGALESAAEAAAAGHSACADPDAFGRTLLLACQSAAREAGKLVRLTFSAGKRAFEPVIARRLLDALLPLVRRSVARGIEAPAERAESGKPAAGRIDIRLSRVGRELRVDYSDDGCGPDPATLRKRAVERGLLSREAADALDDREAARLVFRGELEDPGAAEEPAFGLSATADFVMRRLKGRLALTCRGFNGFRLRMTIPLD